MAELIIVKNKPSFNELLSGRQYTRLTYVNSEIVLQDLNGHKAVCRFGDGHQLEYIKAYLSFDVLLFAMPLKAKYGTYWIQEEDLNDYNRFSVSKHIDYGELSARLSQLQDEFGFTFRNQQKSESLWNQLNSVQRAKVLPKGYIRNYLYSRPPSRRKELDLYELLEDCLMDRIVFGIPL
jgi:hypothetical protein